jgi:alkaline phosphatase D
MLKRMGVLWWKPIWNVAVQQGVRTAAFTGCSDTGREPSIFKTYDTSVPYSSRIETVIEWLKLPERNVHI